MDDEDDIIRPGDSMPKGMPFDFYKEFLGVDVAKVEQIGELIGIATAALINGMVKSGMTEHAANIVLANATGKFFEALFATFKD